VSSTASAEVNTLWLLAADGIVFSLAWQDLEARCRQEVDPDITVSETERQLPVEYAKWRLDGLDAVSDIVRLLRVSPRAQCHDSVYCFHV
jgi:hypothetical protein